MPLSGLTFTSSTAASIMIGPDMYILENANWSFDQSTGEFTSNVVIPAGSSQTIGIRITRGSSPNQGANGSVTLAEPYRQTTTIANGTGGGETSGTNNTIRNTILKNN